MKIFISYSKKDKNYLDDFLRHLQPVLRSINAEAWCDINLAAGLWDKEQVVHNLNDSQVLVFLTSSYSLATDYIVDVEIPEAVKSGGVIIPILLSPCSWENTDLKRYTIKPEKAVPLTNLPDPEMEWVRIVEFVKSAIESKGSDMVGTLHRRAEFMAYVAKNEPKFGEHNISALDIYVYPDLREKSGSATLYTSSEDLLKNNSNSIVFGNTQSGKSLLAKKLCIDTDVNAAIVVYINGAEIVNRNPRALLAKKIDEQYGISIDAALLVGVKVLIDDPGASSLGKAPQRDFYSELEKISKNVYLFYPESQKYHIDDIDIFGGYVFYEILDFNRKKREKLIKNWYEVGSQICGVEEDVYLNVDARLNELDTFLSKDIVPSRPFFILSILNQLEVANSPDLNMTSYGHCYQALITGQLMKAGVNGKDIEEYVNFLTELSYFIFKNSNKINDVRFMSETGLHEFFSYYNSEYYCKNIDSVFNLLLKSEILAQSANGVCFVYKYIYYFYVGKYFGENLDTPGVGDGIDILLDQMHVDEYANIIIFLNHHNKNPSLLSKIQEKVLSNFGDIKLASLSVAELEFLSDFIKNVPELVVSKKNDTPFYRDNKNNEIEKLEKNNASLDRQAEFVSKDSHIAIINRSLKSLDLIGQIIKNRHGSIKRTILQPLAKAALESNLKFISFFLDHAKMSQDVMVSAIADRFETVDSLDKENIQKEARGLYLYLVYGAMFGIIKKFALSVSSRESIDIAYDVARHHGGDVGAVYEALLHLSHEKLNVHKLRVLVAQLNANPIAKRLVQEAAVYYMYMKDVSYREKQSVTAIFDMRMEEVKSLQFKKERYR